MRFAPVFIGLGLAVGLVGSPAPAHAEVNCGCRSGSWNAPDGALVLSRSDSIVGRALSGGGETTSHSLLSHGAYATHASLDPDKLIKKGWPNYCSGGPVTASSLGNGRPGMTNIKTGGATYAYYMLSQDALQDIFWQLPAKIVGTYPFSFENPNWTWATSISYWMNYGMMYEYVPMEWLAGSGNSLTPAAGDFWYTLYAPDGDRQPYFLHQFVNIMGRHAGGIPANVGAVCSTAIAWGEWYDPYVPPFNDGLAKTHTYTHNQLVALGNAIKNGAQDACDEGYVNELAGLTCLESVCDDFGRQVRNCVATGSCGSDSSSTWNTVANDPNKKPVTISPSRLGGWDGHGESGNTPWTGEAKHTMVWAAPGNTCSCWSIR
jgi:hypothetical protein